MSKDKSKIDKGKRRKRTRNKGRDVFADYYYTNREYARSNAEQQKGQPRWNSTAKIYLGVILVGLIGIFVRYVVLK